MSGPPRPSGTLIVPPPRPDEGKKPHSPKSGPPHPPLRKEEEVKQEIPSPTSPADEGDEQELAWVAPMAVPGNARPAPEKQPAVSFEVDIEPSPSPKASVKRAPFKQPPLQVIIDQLEEAKRTPLIDDDSSDEDVAQPSMEQSFLDSLDDWFGPASPCQSPERGESLTKEERLNLIYEEDEAPPEPSPEQLPEAEFAIGEATQGKKRESCGQDGGEEKRRKVGASTLKQPPAPPDTSQGVVADASQAKDAAASETTASATTALATIAETAATTERQQLARPENTPNRVVAQETRLPPDHEIKTSLTPLDNSKLSFVAF